MVIDQTALDALVQIYKNGIKNWHKDEFFLSDCAFYEGKIKKACEELEVDVPFTYVSDFTDDKMVDSYNYGYNSWD
jgi:hypothetical protein